MSVPNVSTSISTSLPWGMHDEELRQGADFLETYDNDEIEEIACIRDYLYRQMINIFNLIEDDFVEGRLSKIIQRAPQPLVKSAKEAYWFGAHGNLASDSYVEFMISLGLPFLREHFTADYVRRAELVLKHVLDGSHVTSGVLQRTFSLSYRAIIQDRRSNPVYSQRFLSSYQDSLEEPSIECTRSRVMVVWESLGTTIIKDFETGACVFWDKRRMMAAISLES